MKNAIIFSGSGGQGIMSMGIMLAQSAVESGKHAVYLPSYGAEQRGGSAKCVVIIDDEEIVSPMTKYAGTFVALSDTGYNKFIDELEPGGLLIYDSALVTSVTTLPPWAFPPVTSLWKSVPPRWPMSSSTVSSSA